MLLVDAHCNITWTIYTKVLHLFDFHFPLKSFFHSMVSFRSLFLSPSHSQLNSNSKQTHIALYIFTITNSFWSVLSIYGTNIYYIRKRITVNKNFFSLLTNKLRFPYFQFCFRFYLQIYNMVKKCTHLKCKEYTQQTVLSQRVCKKKYRSTFMAYILVVHIKIHLW